MPASILQQIGSLLVLSVFFVSSGQQLGAATDPLATDESVGNKADGRIVTPVNQVLTPFGRQLDLPGLRPQAVALSPNGRLLVTAGKTNELIVVDPDECTIIQRVPLPGWLPEERSQPESKQAVPPTDTEGQLSYTGLVFSPAGDRIYMSDVNGSIKVFQVTADGKVSPARAWKLPEANAPRRKPEIPSGLAVSTKGIRLYVCGNLSNQLFELDAESGKVLRSFPVGVAPFDVVLVGSKAYVSNWGGRRPAEGDLTGPAGRGTVVRVDPTRHIASEGSVTAIDLEAGRVITELVTGLHASGLAASAAHPYVVCCNAASDYLSIIDTRSDTEVATVWSKPSPADLLGAGPNAAAFDAAGERLYVANGSQNAIAVFHFDADEPEETSLLGMIPVGWYPGALLVDDARGKIVAANIKGVAKQPKPYRSGATPDAEGFNTHHYFGSLSIFEVPTDDQLPELSERVSRNLRAPRIAAALLPPRPGQPPRAVPERIGEPSLIKHVVYIIKENRTYDQVLGSLGRGKGDRSLCIFGQTLRRITTKSPTSSCCSITRTAVASSVPTVTSGAPPPTRPTIWKRALPAFRGATPTAWESTKTTHSLTHRRASSGITPWSMVCRFATMASSWGRPSAGATSRRPVRRTSCRATVLGRTRRMRSYFAAGPVSNRCVRFRRSITLAGNVGARSVPRRLCAPRTGGVRETWRIPPAGDHLPASGPHQWHLARLSNAGGVHGRQRLGLWPLSWRGSVARGFGRTWRCSRLRTTRRRAGTT